MNSTVSATKSQRHRNPESGFSLIELAIVCIIALTLVSMAMIQLKPSMQAAESDAAMRQVIEQMRQAREYSITNHRYVAVSFVTSGSQSQVILTQKNSQTTDAGADVVLSTVPIQGPMLFCVCGMSNDTPDAYGNGSPIYFEGQANGPSGGMWFQSDGELVDGTTLLPINGTVFMGISGRGSSQRAVTVLGTTGRIRGYRSNGTNWVVF